MQVAAKQNDFLWVSPKKENQLSSMSLGEGKKEKKQQLRLKYKIQKAACWNRKGDFYGSETVRMML